MGHQGQTTLAVTAGAASTVPTHANSGEIGVKPEPFTGDRTKLRCFKTCILMFLHANSVKYSTDATKMSLLLDLCQGEVSGSWSKSRSLEILEDDDAVAAGTANYVAKFSDWKSLLTRFEKDFAPLDPTPAVRATLAQLKMGTRLVTDYIMAFEVLVPQTK
ncbi:hypothetical protein BV25DRAFT_1922060 [Artomyces pyxidatus]|uniref:Uncharacterized protein n=1 Tax=Artomyces pyxidatus TaxID=48021 RepID=A0ACB8SHF9_9AGAM|nr:hypothetical protein BV25DRAFT_1922060 [Artomyces pyxidatus]